jgi:hypothetical protein
MAGNDQQAGQKSPLASQVRVLMIESETVVHAMQISGKNSGRWPPEAVAVGNVMHDLLLV